MRFPADSGRASLEFLVGAVILFVPIVTIQTLLSTVSQAQLGVEMAARHCARIFVQQVSMNAATEALRRSVEQAVRDFGIDTTPSIALRCRPQNSCLAPGSIVDVSVSVVTPLGHVPLIPADLPVSVPIRAEASAQVSVFRGYP